MASASTAATRAAPAGSTYVLRRLKTDNNVIADLPDKTEVNAYCLLSKPQAALYQQSVDEMKKAIAELEGIERRGVVLAFLMRFKQICNHPSQCWGLGATNPPTAANCRGCASFANPLPHARISCWCSPSSAR